MNLHGHFFVREAKAEDLLEAKTVHARAFAPLAGIYRFTGDTLARQEERFHDGVRLVALQEGRIVGTMQYRCDARHVHLLALAVLPDFQRLGAGRTLVEHAAHLSPALGHHTLALDTIAETGNVPRFERMGFRVVQTRVAQDCVSERFGTLHLVTMERELG